MHMPDPKGVTDSPEIAVSAHGLVKRFGATCAVDAIDITVPTGAIYGILGPNGAGKTTTLRMLMGIIEPDSGQRRILGAAHPHDRADQIGYLPEERGLYPAMTSRETIAFAGAIRGLPLAEGRRRADALLAEYGLVAVAKRPIRTLSKGMAQTVQLLGTIVHNPRLVVLDEPFSGLDALNQGRLERMIRALAADGVTILFSTHVIAHAERLCESVTIIAGGRVRFEGSVDSARDRMRPRVRLQTRAADGPWRSALPADAVMDQGHWSFALPQDGIEPLLRILLTQEAGIQNLAIERASLHDAFVDIAGAAVAAQLAASDAPAGHMVSDKDSEIDSGVRR